MSHAAFEVGGEEKMEEACLPACLLAFLSCSGCVLLAMAAGGFGLGR